MVYSFISMRKSMFLYRIFRDSAFCVLANLPEIMYNDRDFEVTVNGVKRNILKDREKNANGGGLYGGIRYTA